MFREEKRPLHSSVGTMVTELNGYEALSMGHSFSVLSRIQEKMMAKPFNVCQCTQFNYHWWTGSIFYQCWKVDVKVKLQGKMKILHSWWKEFNTDRLQFQVELCIISIQSDVLQGWRKTLACWHMKARTSIDAHTPARLIMNPVQYLAIVDEVYQGCLE